jgi:hypothetical protein
MPWMKGQTKPIKKAAKAGSRNSHAHFLMGPRIRSLLTPSRFFFLNKLINLAFNEILLFEQVKGSGFSGPLT